MSDAATLLARASEYDTRVWVLDVHAKAFADAGFIPEAKRLEALAADCRAIAADLRAQAESAQEPA